MKKREKTGYWRRAGEEIRRHPVLAGVYFVLRLIVLTILTINIVEREYESAFICVLALVLFLLPAFLEKSLRMDIPSVMECIILLFVFAAEILGELQNYYNQYPYWDTMLHTANGFLCAAFGFSLVDILCRNKQQKFNLSPLYVALVAFCFSMTVGVLWEFFEYGMDRLFLTDMQKDTTLSGAPGLIVDFGNGKELLRGVTELTVEGHTATLVGYREIGLYDTMADLFVNFVGAVVFSVFGYIYIRQRGQGRSGRILRHFVPQPVDLPASSDQQPDSPITE